ncbi:MAG: magnesium and cobalt transport protein CorA [Desulfobulbaceae bacterium]|nr:MAG: magnesium and cobalt transport protein CorA [Desulfobulbaceae bacterium]
MERILKTFSQKAGLPPGSLVHVGNTPTGDTKIKGLRFTETEFEVFAVPDNDALMRLKEKEGTIWLQVDGLHQPEKISAIGEIFSLHALTQEDILNTGQRPKMEEFDDYLFLVGKILSLDETLETVQEKHFCLVLLPHTILSFHEAGANIFASVENRLQKSNGKIRKKSADYLAYALFDAMVDNYFLVLEKLGAQIEELEEEILTAPSRASLEWLHFLKRELTILRKSVWPLRDVINSMVRTDSDLVVEDTVKYFMDVYDHTMQVLETLEAFRDVTASLYDMYLSAISNRMNEVMKVLTVIATIFIPLTFVVGIYGMNFHYMPELAWKWGYFVTLAIMAILGTCMAVYFKRKDWF